MPSSCSRLQRCPHSRQVLPFLSRYLAITVLPSSSSSSSSPLSLSLRAATFPSSPPLTSPPEPTAMSSPPAALRPPPPPEPKPEDSDEDLFTVPDVESAPGDGSPAAAAEARRGSGEGPSKARKGRNPAEREYRRLKRLLRNRVSAQQARERKKAYLSDLESAAKELCEQNMELEEKISTLLNENTMLRKVLMSSRPKLDDGVENDEKD